MINLGNKIRALRKKKGITQEQYPSGRWGTSYPDIGMFPIIANLFKVSTDYLLGVDITKQRILFKFSE